MDQDARNLLMLVGGWYTDFVMPLAAVLTGIVILIAGIMYVTSAGDAAKIGKAKELIFGSLTGLVVLICAALFIRVLIT